MYLLSFGIACTPTLAGVTARSQVRIMTLRELLTRIKPGALEESPKDKIQRILQEANFEGEYTVYPVAGVSSWTKAVNEVLQIKPEDTAGMVGVTGYSTDANFFNRLETILKAKFNQVHRVSADEMGWKKILVCAESEEAVPLLVCANYYSTSREAVKAQFNSASPTETDSKTSNTNSDEPADIDLDPFE